MENSNKLVLTSCPQSLLSSPSQLFPARLLLGRDFQPCQAEQGSCAWDAMCIFVLGTLVTQFVVWGVLRGFLLGEHQFSERRCRACPWKWHLHNPFQEGDRGASRLAEPGGGV